VWEKPGIETCLILMGLSWIEPNYTLGYNGLMILRLEIGCEETSDFWGRWANITKFALPTQRYEASGVM